MGVLDFDEEDLGVPEAKIVTARACDRGPTQLDRNPENSPLARRHYEFSCQAQHSSKSVEHYTPRDIIERARFVMGSIDVDPASSWLAQQTVQAKQWFGIQEGNAERTDGLNAEWHGNVWLNPPGGKTSDHSPHLSFVSKSHACVWWVKLIDEIRKGHCAQAIFLGFTLELLATIQKASDTHPMQWPTVILRDRLRFDYPKDTTHGLPQTQTEIVQGSQPTHANFLSYFGPSIDRFQQAFGELGFLA